MSLDFDCPYCGRHFDGPDPNALASEIGAEYREHMRVEHPVQDHDLGTTRYRDGVFVRCEPEQPHSRTLRIRRQPRAGHGFARLEHVDGERESAHEGVVIACKCGWNDLAVMGEGEAWHSLYVHFRNDYRQECPYCGRRFEDQLREPVERYVAEHIGSEHPDRFPWGFEGPTAVAVDPTPAR